MKTFLLFSIVLAFITTNVMFWKKNLLGKINFDFSERREIEYQVISNLLERFEAWENQTLITRCRSVDFLIKNHFDKSVVSIQTSMKKFTPVVTDKKHFNNPLIQKKLAKFRIFGLTGSSARLQKETFIWLLSHKFFISNLPTEFSKNENKLVTRRTK